MPAEEGAEGEGDRTAKANTCPAVPESSSSEQAEAGWALVYEGEKTNCVVCGLRPGQRVTVRIRATGQVGSSEWASQSFTACAAVPSRPDPPDVLSRTSDSLTVGWQPPADNGAPIQVRCVLH